MLELAEPYRRLADRIGEDVLAARLLRQASHVARLTHQGEGFFAIEKFVSVDRLAGIALTLSGLSRAAFRNFLDIRTVEREWWIPGLPPAFDGFRLLQLTDLHLDLHPAIVPAIAAAVRRTPHDAAVITGDFRNSTDQDYTPSLEAARGLVPLLSPQRMGILGNHDFIEITWGLEEAGLPILLNEARPLTREGSELWVAGVDDPHFYRSHDFARARRAVPPGAPCILLCHTPEAADEAASHGFSLMLCGHTHGGQLCLPGGIPVVVPVRKLPRERISGRWKCGEMQGFTSPGTGSCGLPARLNCPPEISLHILRTGN